jgi:hypothetical protein
MPAPQTQSYVTNPVSASTTRTKATEGSGTVVALMGITVLFALIGNEIEGLSENGKGTGTTGSDRLTKSGTIIVGGVVGTALLTLLTHAGDTGRQFAVGLALVTMATATLVYGGPVWDTMNNAFGSKPTGTTGVTTPTTTTKG